MSHYVLVPPPHQHQTHAWWTGGFSKEDCEKVIAIGESKPWKEAKVGLDGDAVVDTKIRRAKTSWISSDDAPWLYERLGFIVRYLNGDAFGFDIHGFYENFQYTVYEAGQGGEHGFYDWHIDEGFDKNRPPRKLTLSMQLTDPSEYEGGELIINPSTVQITTCKDQGHIILFPSFYQHRVMPVTKGIRRSLVTWITGPRFR